MKRAFIIHGYTGHPTKNWFPWLKGELEQHGYQVEVPAMPHADAPQLDEWLPYLGKCIGQPDRDTYLIGHSLGCITILRYLESLPEGEQIAGTVLVAGFSRKIHFHELDNFFEQPLDYSKCAAATQAITCINSTNDPHVPLEEGEVLRDKLGAKLIVIENGGHLNEKFGYTQLQIVLDEVLNFPHLD